MIPATMDSVLMSEWRANSNDKIDTLGKFSSKIICCSTSRASLQAKTHVLLFMWKFLMVNQNNPKKSQKKSQYSKKTQGWGTNLVANWVLHVNVLCPLGSYLSLPLYLTLEQWTLLIPEIILCTFTYTSKQCISALSQLLHGTLHVSLQRVCDIWTWEVSKKTFILISIILLREREIEWIKHIKHSRGRSWTQNISG